MPNSTNHLTKEQLERILQIVEGADAIVIGGQSINIWAYFYSTREARLAAFGPFTSKDIDFYKNQDAAERLAKELNGEIKIPGPDDHSPNAALVLAQLDNRKIEIDFMVNVLGVPDASVKNNYITLEGMDGRIKILVLHPLDCLKSRIANINVLGRKDELAINQAKASLLILENYIDEMLASGAANERKEAQNALMGIAHLTRKECRYKPIYLEHGIDPRTVMRAFSDDERFDARWRQYNLNGKLKELDDLFSP